MNMKRVLYFFHSPRREVYRAIMRGEEKNDGKLLGMKRLAKYSYKADLRELEDYLPKNVARWVYRHILNVYAVHLPLFFCMFGYDVVFSATAFSNLLLKALLGIRRPHWVIFDFGLDGLLGDGKTLKQRALRYAIAQGADGIVCLSNGEAEALRARFPAKAARIIVVPHGVATEYFTPRPSVPEERSIFSPGRDIGRDFATLFAATAGLEVPVLITAPQSHLTNLLPLPPFVTQRNLSNEEMLDAYARAAIVVLPITLLNHSNDASGCSTLIEALSMGRAVIATHTKTMEGYIEDGVNGVLVPPEDPEALRRAIESLLADPARRTALGQRARERAERELAADRFAEALARFFDSLG